MWRQPASFLCQHLATHINIYLVPSLLMITRFKQSDELFAQGGVACPLKVEWCMRIHVPHQSLDVVQGKNNRRATRAQVQLGGNWKNDRRKRSWGCPFVF